MVKDSLVCWFPVNLNAGATCLLDAEVNLMCLIVASSSGVHWQFIKLRSHIYEMRLNWFARPVVGCFFFFFLLLFLVAAGIFTIRPARKSGSDGWDSASSGDAFRDGRVPPTRDPPAPLPTPPAGGVFNHAVENPTPPRSGRASGWRWLGDPNTTDR